MGRVDGVDSGAGDVSLDNSLHRAARSVTREFGVYFRCLCEHIHRRVDGVDSNAGGVSYPVVAKSSSFSVVCVNISAGGVIGTREHIRGLREHIRSRRLRGGY